VRRTLLPLAITMVLSITSSAFFRMRLKAEEPAQTDAGQASGAAKPREQETVDERQKAMANRLEHLTRKSQTAGAQEVGQSKKSMGSGLSTRDIMPEAPEVFSEDPAVKTQYLEALREYYRYRVTGYQHRQRVFAWQLFSSKFIFVMVLLLEFLGMYFAALQFHAGLKFLKKGLPEEAGFKTDLEAEVGKIKVSSPVLGVVILSLSLAFFYLYLLYVYPIQETF
jgi:hypothetical protein